MAKWKPGLHKEVSAIFDGVPVPEESDSHKRNEALASRCSTVRCPQADYFCGLESQGLDHHHRPTRKNHRLSNYNSKLIG